MRLRIRHAYFGRGEAFCGKRDEHWTWFLLSLFHMRHCRTYNATSFHHAELHQSPHDILSPERHFPSVAHVLYLRELSSSLLSPSCSSSCSFSSPPSLFSSSFAPFGSCPITASNCDQSASTEPNSLPTAMTPSRERLSLLMFARTCSRLYPFLNQSSCSL